MPPNRLLAAALSSAVLALASPSHAASLPADGSWQVFDIDEFLSGALAFIDIADGSPLSFEFSIDTGQIGTLTVVDAGFAGDRFEILDGAQSLGLSSAPGASFPDSVGLDFDAALADPAYSRGVFVFGAGNHLVTGALVQSVELDGLPLNATVGALRLTVSPVPEPATAASLLAGMALLAGLRRRAR